MMEKKLKEHQNILKIGIVACFQSTFVHCRIIIM